MTIVLHGIDFSGAENPAGKIWVATRSGGSIELRRGLDHRALVELVVQSQADGRDHLWLLDAPFGLAGETLAAHGLESSWSAVAAWLERWPNPRAWRSACRDRSRAEPRRRADREARTPMAPQNLRVFKQTWSAIVRVLAPLAARGVRVEPLAGPSDARVVVAEGCPASAMHRRGWPVRGYKGGGEPPRERRREILAALEREGLAIPPRAAQQAIDDTEGDALDALLLVLDPLHTVAPREGLVEGWVY